MALVNPDPLRYPGSASTVGGTQTSPDADTTAATTWLQQQPWYRSTLQSWGNPETLTLGQRGYLARTAQQAGLNPDFGINTDGSVEDWSTPTGAKIALAAFAAWAGGTELGLLGNGSGAASAAGPAATEGIPSATALGLPATSPVAAAPLASTPLSAGVFGAPTSTPSLTMPGSSFGLPDWLQTAQDVGQSLSAASAGRAQGRVMEGRENRDQARAAVDLYNAQLRAPGDLAGNAVRGDILSRAQDATISGISPNIPIPIFSGGLRPSMFSDATRDTGRMVTGNARDSAALLKPLTPPVLPALPEAGTLDSVLNGASSVANVAGAVPWDKIPWGKLFGR